MKTRMRKKTRRLGADKSTRTGLQEKKGIFRVGALREEGEGGGEG
jgi:hypothetical protein